MVPDALIVHFFEAATKGLDNIVDISNSRHRPPRHLSLADCKRYVLELQKEVLQETLQDYNEKHESAVTIDEAQQALAELNPLEPNSALSVSRTTMEEAARCALCRLVLYTEIHWEADKDDDDGISRNLQTQGHLDRAKLLDMIALCQTAIKLPEVQQYLADGSLFFLEQPTTDNLMTLPVPNNKEPTIMKFPQARLEKIQRYIAQSIGWDPDFLSRELRRLFFTPDITPANTNDPTDHWARDPEVTTRFHQLIKEMSLAVSKATLQSSTSGHPLSDVEEGGVTRVVSVQCTELPFDTVPNEDHDGHGPMGVSAPGKMTIDPHLSEEEQKRQLRLASEATKLQQEIMRELMNMTEEQRNQRLLEAEQATEEFLQNTLALPPGMERIAYLQSVDPHTSKLLAIHKLWQTVQQSSNSHNK